MTSAAVQERNHRFMARYEVALRQREISNGGVHTLFGHYGDLTISVVNATNTKIVGFSANPDRINDDVEIKLETPGHEWYLTYDRVDDLMAFLLKIREGRKE